MDKAVLAYGDGDGDVMDNEKRELETDSNSGDSRNGRTDDGAA